MNANSVLTKKYPSLAAVCHATAKAAPSGLDAKTVAQFMGKPYQTLMSELSRQDGHKLGADLLLPLMDICGSDAPLHFLSREMGGVYVPLPSNSNSQHPVHKQCMVAVAEFGELIGSVGKALEDGTITREECEDVSRAGYEAIQAISALQLAMNKSKE